MFWLAIARHCILFMVGDSSSLLSLYLDESVHNLNSGFQISQTPF